MERDNISPYLTVEFNWCFPYEYVLLQQKVIFDSTRQQSVVLISVLFLNSHLWPRVVSLDFEIDLVMPNVMRSLSDHSRLNQRPVISVDSSAGGALVPVDSPSSSDQEGEDLAQLGLCAYCSLPKTAGGRRLWWQRYVEYAAGLGGDRRWIESLVAVGLSPGGSTQIVESRGLVQLRVMVPESVDTVAFAQLLITNIVRDVIPL